MLRNLMGRLYANYARTREYRRACAEIDGMTTRDLADMRADRGEMKALLRERFGA